MKALSAPCCLSIFTFHHTNYPIHIRTPVYETINKENIVKAIHRFSNINILVLGDIIVDHFIWGNVTRISPEAPVPVVNVTKENLLLGGSANVLNNIYAMGGKAALCGVIGTDWMGGKLIELLQEIQSPSDGVIKDADRPTTKKPEL